MFSKQITTSDAFVEMPVSSQLLYFHLNMEADDDGFVSNPKRIMRMLGVNEDDLKILLAKRFLLAFENGVVVIKHWLLHNAVRKDMYKETQYIEQKNMLRIKDNGVYTEVRNETVTLPLHRLDKDRLDKNKLRKNKTTQIVAEKVETYQKEIIEIIDAFKEINSEYKSWYGNKTQRNAILRLLETKGIEMVLKVITILPKTNTMPFMPVITTPYKLAMKWSDLQAGMAKKKNEIISKGKGLA